MALNSYRSPIDNSADMAYSGAGVDLGQIIVEKDPRAQMRQFLMENSAVGVRPSTALLHPEQAQKVKDDAAKQQFLDRKSVV